MEDLVPTRQKDRSKLYAQVATEIGTTSSNMPSRMSRLFKKLKANDCYITGPDGDCDGSATNVPSKKAGSKKRKVGEAVESARMTAIDSKVCRRACVLQSSQNADDTI